MGSGVVRLGVEAPHEMPVVREELKDQLRSSNVPPPAKSG